MARYYDLDKLGEMIEAKADTLVGGKEAFLYVAGWLKLLPADDVAPRAEVARDIFEDIAKVFFEKQKHYENSHQSGKARQMMAARFEVYKLRKKYTEAEPPKGDHHE